MNIRNLRNKLPGVTIRRNGRKIEVRAAGLGYDFDGRDKSRSESEMAAHIRSKIPVAAIMPPQS